MQKLLNHASRRRTVDDDYKEISRKYVELAQQHIEKLQAKWKEAMDKAIEFQEAFKQEKK